LSDDAEQKTGQQDVVFAELVRQARRTVAVAEQE
jgi:hypothetical protein